MVEYSLRLDTIFSSLADPTRRDILQRVARSELPVGEIAAAYEMSLPAVSKHLKILEKAKLIIKRRQGKQLLVRATPATLNDATEYLEWYREHWEQRLGSLEQYLNESKE
jgi:DNA-binding transcriptional ArsR family regulator